MRPIRLRMSGLNSFREFQEINFSRLCETGVFGIFGPTGSGKSSILDAITLALFGTVERAANNTQGILNHGEDSLWVEFTFSLGSGIHNYTYRAERAYKRSGDITIKTSVCRLIELTNGEDVLASKADEMTDKIEQILGLNAQDFTRAVVLPQGKFAEFLTIKPKERRQMLERLFNLEVYGRQLSGKLNEKMAQTQLSLTGVMNRQQGLGDASEDRIKQAQAELLEADVMVTTRINELKNLQSAYDEVKTIWQLQEQLKRNQEALNELYKQLNDVEGMKDKLIRAERAEQIRPRLEEVEKLEQNYQTVSITLEGITQELATVQSKVVFLSDESNRAQRERMEREPFLLRKIEQVEQGIILEKEKNIQEGQLKELRQSYDELAKKKKVLTLELMELEKLISGIRYKEESYKNRLYEISITPDDREKAAKALKILEALEQITTTLQIQQKETIKVKTELDKAKTETEAAKLKVVNQEELLKASTNKFLELENNRPPVSEESLGIKGQELERLRSIIGVCVKTFDRWQQSITKEQQLFQKVEAVYAQMNTETEEGQTIQFKLDTERKKIEILTKRIKEFEDQYFSSRLAISLKDDEPCPVCGSKNHPQLARLNESEIILKTKSELSYIEETVKRLEKQHNEMLTQIAVTRSNHQNLTNDFNEQKTEVELLKREHFECTRQLPEVTRDMTTDQRNAFIKELELTLQQEWSTVAQWKRERDTIEKAIKAIQEQLTQEKELLSRDQVKHNTLTGQHQALTQREQDLTSEYEWAKKEFIRVGQHDSEIREQNNKYQAWDKEYVTINEELKEIALSLVEHEKKYNSRIENRNELELSLKGLEVEGREVAQGVKEKQTKLQQLLEGKSAQNLLAELNNELKQVTERDVKFQMQLGEANNKFIEISQRHAVLTREIQITSDNLDVGRTRLKQELENAGFESSIVALDSLCSLADRQELQTVIKDYERNATYLNGQINNLTKELNKRKITSDEWLSWPPKMKLGEEAYEKALTLRGAAEKILVEITNRHDQWKELENQKLELDGRLNQLKILQTLLRGNAFVEFIAAEQLSNVALDASERLGQLTNHRYALELDSDGGFIMRDNANGGYRRPVSTLSGGETFLTSLALALSLSSQIQLRGEIPLEFFFLDEGFGTLDPDLLEVVMQTLEKLHLQNLTIGIISHVPELRNRLARRLIVTPAQPGGSGSQVKLELA